MSQILLMQLFTLQKVIVAKQHSQQQRLCLEWGMLAELHGGSDGAELLPPTQILRPHQALVVEHLILKLQVALVVVAPTLQIPPEVHLILVAQHPHQDLLLNL